MDTSAATVGMIGLGSMGAPVAKRILAARGELVIHARRPQPELVEAGATWSVTPRDLASRVDVLLSLLPDLPELEALLEGEDGLLAGAGDLLILIGSTSSAPGPACSVDDRNAGKRLVAISWPVSEKKLAAPTLATP
ncbi:MAG TPA: NAD(P)-binding domain-containing protein, partial [Microbacterium sp.]|nr:NAD(P)-binding domain-containing protein [Microbacterium sp.]